MRLPQDVVSDPDVLEEAVERVVAPEKCVQTCFEDIAVAVAPRRKLPAEDGTLLEDGRGPARVC
jgi:hypothetical protein